jgi:hypothetical protein
MTHYEWFLAARTKHLAERLNAATFTPMPTWIG